MMAKRTALALLGIAVAGLSMAVGAVRAEQPAGPASAPVAATPAQKAVLERQVHMEKMFASFNAIYGEMIKEAPDVAVIRREVATLKDQAVQLPGWFPAGTGPEAGIRTRAMPVIWTDAQGFAAEAAKLRIETGKLQLLADAGNLPDMVDRIGWISDTCGECHKRFRAPGKAH